MKRTWSIRRLGEISTVGSGNSAPQNPAAFRDGVFPFFRMSDVGKIRKGHISSSVDYLNESGIKKLTKFKANSILFPKCGASIYLNHRVIMDVDGFVSSHLAVITPDESVVHPVFLLYYLYTIDSADLIQDNDYPTLKLSQISSIPVHLPPVEKQEKIVEVLNAVFVKLETVRHNAEQNLVWAKDLQTQVLTKAFNGEL